VARNVSGQLFLSFPVPSNKRVSIKSRLIPFKLFKPFLIKLNFYPKIESQFYLKRTEGIDEKGRQHQKFIKRKKERRKNRKGTVRKNEREHIDIERREIKGHLEVKEKECFICWCIRVRVGVWVTMHPRAFSLLIFDPVAPDAWIFD